MLIPDWTLFAAAVVYALPLAILLIWKPVLGIAFAAFPLCLFLVTHGPAALYVLVAATFIFIPLHGTFSILPPDLAAFILVAAYGIDLLCRGRSRQSNQLAGPFLIYFAIVFLSVAASGFTALSVKFFLRQSLLVTTFLAVSHFGPRINIRNVFILFVVTADLNSIYSLKEFFGAGGAIRAFGLAGQGYGDHVMLAFVISAVFYLWTKDIRTRIFWGISALIMVGALAATQTRASAITAGWAFVVLMIMAIRFGKIIKFAIPRKSLIAATVLLAAIFPILIFFTPVFEGIAYRFGRIGLQASGTILLRLSLWETALTAFWSNPLLGIGAGNFAQVYRWIPEVKFDPIYFLVSGLSAHAVVFGALAETGILGFLSMYYFFGRAVRTAYRQIKGAVSVSDMAVSQCLFICALVIVGSSFYAGSWFWGNNSYHMAIIFGLIASFRHQPEDLINQGAAV
jgi:O-antigen ligase